MSGIVVGQGLLIVGEAKLGLAGVGIIALASTISQYSDRADQAITQTIYPTICAVKDRADLLYEAFVKSNRLALMWGAPFGLGSRCSPRTSCSSASASAGAPGSGSCRRSASRSPCTRSASTGTPSTAREPRRSRSRSPRRISIFAFLALGLPLLATEGLRGLAIATVLVEGVNFTIRMVFLRRLFPDFRFLRHAGRALLPSLPAVAVVVAVRLAFGEEGTLVAALAVFALYVVTTLAATALIERKLLREMLAYLRRRPAAGAPA